MSIVIKNNASNFLADGINDSQTTIDLQSAASFPSLSAGEYFYGTVESVSGQIEIVKVTNVAGNTLTVVRAQEGTSAAPFVEGSKFELRITVGAVEDYVEQNAELADYTPDGSAAVTRDIRDKLRETISVKDFGAVGDGVADDTVAIQAAFDAANAAAPKKVVLFPAGDYKITSTVNANGLPIHGVDRNLSRILSNVASGSRTFSNVGQTVANLQFRGGGTLPDGFAIIGYKNYIQNCLFHDMGDCICGTNIFVTVVVNACEFLACNSAMSDKLHDGTSAHTTVWFTDNNVLYGNKGFDIKTEAAGFLVEGCVFEDMAYVWHGYGAQIFNSAWIKNWVEQVFKDCTLYFNTFAGGTNVHIMNDLRPGSKTITDSAKWNSSSVALGGALSGGGGGISLDTSGLRVADFNGYGFRLTPAGIFPSSVQASFTAAQNLTIQTNAANSNFTSVGGDIILDFGNGSNAQRRGGLNIPNASGSNVAGRDLRVGGSLSTGSAAGGKLLYYSSTAGTAGSSVNSEVLVFASGADGVRIPTYDQGAAVYAGQITGPGNTNKDGLTLETRGGYFTPDLPLARIKLRTRSALAGNGFAYGDFIVATGTGGNGDGAPAITDRLIIDADGDTYPAATNTYELGLASSVWANIYSQNAVTVVSDEREKIDVAPCSLGLDFITRLEPVSYRLKTGGHDFVDSETEFQTVQVPVLETVDGVTCAVMDDVLRVSDDGVEYYEKVVRTEEKQVPVKVPAPVAGKRIHYGLKAQQVKQTLDELQCPDFGGWVLSDVNNPDSKQALRYEQFVAPLVKAVQELAAEVAALKAQINS